MGDKKIAFQVLGHCLITKAWLHTHGWDVDGRCGCGELGDIKHRIEGCMGSVGASTARLWEILKESKEIPDSRPHKEEGFTCWMNGVRVRPRGLRLGPGFGHLLGWLCLFPQMDEIGLGCGSSGPGSEDKH